MRNSAQKKKHDYYKQIIKCLQPTIRKYGKENVRLALQRFTRIEREKKSLLQQKKEIEKKLIEY